MVEWEQPKCIKQGSERVNGRQSVCEWGGEGKKRVEKQVLRQGLRLVGLSTDFYWELKGCF